MSLQVNAKFVYFKKCWYHPSMRISPESLDATRTAFFQRGESVAEWARANGFRKEMVYAVLSGRAAASRGVSHRIAVRLGLKSSPPCASDQPNQEVKNQ